jgi:hypothetical protein
MHDIYNEEEVPNMKCMCVVEEEVSLSQLKITAVPPEEEEVPVLKGPTIVVPPEAVVPLEEEEVLAPAVLVPQGPPIAVLPEEEEVPTPLVAVLPVGRGCVVPVDC